MTARAGMGMPAMWAQALALGFAMALAPALTALCAILLLPGIAAWYIDSAHGRPMGRAVLAFGTAGAFAPIWQHIQHSQSAQGVIDIAVNSPAIAVAWGLAGIGWLIGRTAQFAVELHIRSEANGRIRQLKAYKRAIDADWDFNPR